MTNPVRVYKLEFDNKKLETKYKLIFVGNPPEYIKSQINKVKNKKEYDRNILKHFYGSLDKLEILTKNIKGSKENEIQLEEQESESNESLIEKQLQKAMASSSEDESLMEINTTDIVEHKAYTETEENIMAIFSEDKADIKIIDKSTNIYSDLIIYPEDKVSEIKDKICIETGIPPFRQHLFVINGNTIPLAYTILKNGVINVDIRTLYDKEFEELNGIPVDNTLFDNSQLIQIVANDTNRIFNYIYDHFKQIKLYVMDLADFIEPIKAIIEEYDTQSMQIMYYGFIIKYFPMLSLDAFKYYIRGDALKSNYPDLVKSIAIQDRYYKKEMELMDKAYSVSNKEISDFERDVKKSIIGADLVVKYKSSIKMKRLEIRNIFDKLELSDDMPYMKLKIFDKGKIIEIEKRYYENYERKTHIINVFRQLMIVIRMSSIKTDKNYNKYIDVNINESGDYNISSDWDDEIGITKKRIREIVNNRVKPLIDKINNIRNVVFIGGTKQSLQYPTETNSYFNKLHYLLIWKYMVNSETFKGYGNKFESYTMTKPTEAQVLINQFKFLWMKGIVETDNVYMRLIVYMQNYYAYLTDPIFKHSWERIFERGRKITFTHRTTDIKIEIEGVKEFEFDFIIKHMVYFMEEASIESIKPTMTKFIKTTNKLRKLKELDPIAYDYKRIYGEKGEVYSKIVQKPFQPTIYTYDEFQSLSAREKKNVLKFWNYTTQTDAYYTCSDPKYPYIKFITDFHPDGYCLIKCVQTPTEIGSEKKTDEWKQCIETHKYIQEQDQQKISRYVIEYGKDISVGRLSKLPNDTLEPLLVDTLPVQYRTLRTDYYIYGVGQHTININNIGMYYILRLMNITINDIVNKLTKNKQYFNIMQILNRNFINIEDFISYFSQVFSKKMYIEKVLDWNSLFIDILKFMFSIKTIIFEDIGYLELIIPKNLKHIEEYINDNGDKYLFVIKKNKSIYPIVIANSDDIFRKNKPYAMLFDYSDEIVISIRTMIQTSLKSEQKYIDLFFIKEFISFTNSNKKKDIYKIDTIYINSQNFCDGVLLKRNKRNVYLPIFSSIYTEIENHSFNFFKIDGSNTFLDDLMDTIIDINHYIALESERKAMIKTIYIMNPSMRKKDPLEIQIIPFVDLIIPETILINEAFSLNIIDEIKSKHKCIGFMSGGFRYYFEKWDLISLNKLKTYLSKLQMKKYSIQKIFYNPDIVYSKILNRAEIKIDNRQLLFNNALYDLYIYKLLIFEFTNKLYQERNIPIRKKLINIINTSSFKKIKEFKDKLDVLLENFQVDKERIISQINNFLITHRDIEQLITEIDETSYDFDKLTIIKIQNLTKREIIKEIEPMISEITITKEFTNNPRKNIENIYSPCVEDMKENQLQCYNRKLIIPKVLKSKFVEILVDDITNPIKKKLLISGIMQPNVRQWYDFIQRDTEIISISIR